ncbi:hypothetical protein [Acinetobacter baumannii]|uniref:hypothetical protein n=1 Tax=Acinetobacter baumannii TaxID=470 RepID=UPI0008DD2E73|nr:hypothetical protein [Acinetobacter baumannii]MCE6930381.1 hypothetical protein [Acinetobacter baumannii]MCZ0638470.1 hypothetical protein [Acinetobacter baumannii]MVO43822.1 hypothetical protein [Acinetobacter baumannii]OIB66666.1 hypothetical protein A7L34_12530 [Acinetobacter baumannii]OIE93347.1 hypothetical protein A7L81_19520 [Acinetobacter baumannii]
MKKLTYSENGRFFYEGSQVITNKLTGTVYYVSLEEKCVVAYKGRAKKPFLYNGFSTIENMKEAVKKSIESDNRSYSNKIADKEAEKQSIAKFRKDLEIGTILYSSWGWEQTNVEFYQVIEKSGAFCTIREIGQMLDPHTDMQGYVVPVPNEFVGEPMQKKIMNGYVVIHKSATASPLSYETLPTGTKVYKRCYTSSYA